ncbi:hypothetical protein [Gilvibacter sp.]|uniref:hypothetical protein n=1 Tax=Gilvibacter sp. TaxID=2729997 RepID=UPI0025C35459|nr:hypothetical protein [Gilvibacter sp.]NQX77505.1 hypothetical protein [Gilvibacter sp.]
MSTQQSTKPLLRGIQLSYDGKDEITCLLNAGPVETDTLVTVKLGENDPILALPDNESQLCDYWIEVVNTLLRGPLREADEVMIIDLPKRWNVNVDGRFFKVCHGGRRLASRTRLHVSTVDGAEYWTGKRHSHA